MVSLDDGRDYGEFIATDEEMMEMEKYHNLVMGSLMLD